MILPTEKILLIASPRNFSGGIFSRRPGPDRIPPENPEGRLAVASNPSICVSIPLISNAMWPFQEIECARDKCVNFSRTGYLPEPDFWTT